MSTGARIGINPFPWFGAAPDSWDLTPERLQVAVNAVADVGFTAIQADIPDGMAPSDYKAALARRGVNPAPSYWGVPFDSDSDAIPGIRDEAKRRAAQQTEIGVDGMVLADELYPPRMSRPSVGADFDSGRLERVIENIGEVASVLVAEGITPYFHQHVGSWIETESELRALLDAVPASTLSFAPDIAHLSWAGADPAALIADYASRVGLIHLKDAHLAAAKRSRDEQLDYNTCVYQAHIFTEPGRGDLDFNTILDALPADFGGWWVVEVDVPDLPTKEESTLASWEWLQEHIVGVAV
jgi:inosose dehydratase